jgi:hypothetical protein
VGNAPIGLQRRAAVLTPREGRGLYGKRRAGVIGHAGFSTPFPDSRHPPEVETGACRDGCLEIVRFTTRAARPGISPIVGRQPARLRRIIRAAGDITLGCAVDAYLATLRGGEQASTRRVYGRILRRLAAKFGSETPPNEIGVERFAVGFGQQ